MEVNIENTLVQLKAGVDKLADAVAVTMGPRGRNVAIKREGLPTIVTKDGVTVAEAITDLSDPMEDIGAEMVRDVASRAGKLAGDGTTTATVLAQDIIRIAMRNIAAGASHIELKRGMDIAVEAVVGSLGEQKIDIELGGPEIRQVATISANNDAEIGEMIAQAFEKVGKNGVVTVEESNSHKTYIDLVKGMQFDRGYLSPMFPNNEAGDAVELQNPMFLLVDGKLTKIDDLLQPMTCAINAGRPLVVIAEDVEGPALSQLVINKLHGALKCVAIKAPGFSKSRFQYLMDIATITKATVFSEITGASLDALDDENIDAKFFGGAEGVTVEVNSTIIVNGIGTDAELMKRVQELEDEVETVETPVEEQLLKTRIAKLGGGVGVLYVGANSVVETKEKKDRADDALCAIQSALKEGIVAGGGTALLNARNVIPSDLPGDQQIGANIIKEACLAPLKTIAENSGMSGDVIVQGVESSDAGIGYDAKNDKFVDMVSCGIVDPKMVTRVALESANSAAGMVILTECAIYS